MGSRLRAFSMSARGLILCLSSRILYLNTTLEFNFSLQSSPGPISGQWDFQHRNLIGEPSVKFLEPLPDYQESNLDKYDGIGEDDEDELKWREYFSQMKTFIEIHDHSNVPFKEYPMLYEWALQHVACIWLTNPQNLVSTFCLAYSSISILWIPCSS